MKISSLDYLLIILYIVGIVILGVWAGFRRHKGGAGKNYFLAGNTLTWPVIGLAMFAANISTVHLVSLAESAYKYGLVYGNFEWMAGFVLIILSLFFAPLYLRSKVPTLPDYLERRFNRNCRDWLAVISIISAVVIHIGVALYTAAWVLRGILDIPVGATILNIDALLFFIILLGILTGVYTMIGGLYAVVLTESVQTVLLLFGAICITVVGFIKIGGWSALQSTLLSNPHPLAGNGLKLNTGNFLNMIRSDNDPSGLPWYSILLGYPVIGIWYWACDQTIVQRVLAAKDERHARLGPLFCAFIKILPVFFFVLPGVICVALVQNNYFNGEAPKVAADTYTFMIIHMLPVGLKGLIAAALLAAAMQTCSAALNSTATLFSYDIFKRYRPNVNDKKLVMVGKIVTVIATILAIILSPIFGHYNTIIEGLNKLISYIAPPITAVFLFGVFWKKASGKAAYITLVSGAVLGFFIFILDWNNWYSGNFMLSAFYLFVICSLILITMSFIYPENLKDEAITLIWSSWKEPIAGKLNRNFITDYRVLSFIIFIIFIVLYYLFK